MIACACVFQESVVAEYLSVWNSERRNVSRNDYIENNIMFSTQLQAHSALKSLQHNNCVVSIQLVLIAQADRRHHRLLLDARPWAVAQLVARKVGRQAGPLSDSTSRARWVCRLYHYQGGTMRSTRASVVLLLLANRSHSS